MMPFHLEREQMHLVPKQQVRAVCTDGLIYFVKRQVNQRFNDPWGPEL